MKIYVSKINESWIVDRFRDEWIKNNSQINTPFAFKADIIWLIAPWVWRNISKKNLANKKVVCTIHHLENDDFDGDKREEFFKRDAYVDIYHVISKNIYSKIIECVGPETITFKQIIEKLLRSIGKKRLLIPIPLKIAELSAGFFELMPNPLLTRDQLRLLKYDNIPSGKYKTNSEIGIPSKRYFDDEVKKYCYMWKEGGQFSLEKYNHVKNLKKDLDHN